MQESLSIGQAFLFVGTPWTVRGWKVAEVGVVSSILWDLTLTLDGLLRESGRGVVIVNQVITDWGVVSPRG